MPRGPIIASALVSTLLPSNAAFIGSMPANAAPAVCRRSCGAMMVETMTAADFKVPGTMSKQERLRSRYSGIAFEPEGGWGTEAEELFGYDDLSAQMIEISSFSRGDSCTGEVISFEPNGALIDIGVKSSAYCSLVEMAIDKPAKPEDSMDLGSSYEFVIISREDENGQLMLSRRRILYQEAWDRVSQLYEEEATVTAKVVAVNRGGAMMNVEGLRAFLPGSHFMAGQNPTEELVGMELKVKFLDVDRETNRLVVSHRKAIVDMQIKNMSVGAVMKGIVTAVKPYGAFVDIGGMSGLLHISQISCDHISNVESIIPVGTELKVMVISQDKGKGRVALSTKTLEAEPGDMLRDQAKVYENAEDTAAKYQERLEAERLAREEAAQDVIFGLESVFADSSTEGEAPATKADLPFEG